MSFTYCIHTYLPNCLLAWQIVPGASVPVALRPGPRDLLSTERWLRMEVCVEGSDGLSLAPADSLMKLLQVEKARA